MESPACWAHQIQHELQALASHWPHFPPEPLDIAGGQWMGQERKVPGPRVFLASWDSV